MELRPIPSPASAGPILSPASARPTPSPAPVGLSTSTTISRRPRDDPEGASTSYLPPPSRRLRRGSSSSVGPPPEVHEDYPVRGPVHVLEPVWYPGGPVDVSLLTSRDSQRFYNHGRKIKDLVQPDQPWFEEVMAASGPRDLCTLDYHTIHNGMLAAFMERWHPETSSFHLPHGEITITLDDVACLLHLPIRGILFRHSRMTKAEAQEMLIAELGVDPDYALEEVERTRGVHVKFSFLQRQSDLELTAAHQAEGDDLEQATHRERHVSMSTTEEGLYWRTITTDWERDTCLDTTTLPRHYWLGRGAHLHRGNVACQSFHCRRGNQHPDPYRRGLDRMAVEDIKYDCYAAHQETVPFDEIAMYSGWLAASSTIIVRYLLERVMWQLGFEQTIPRDPTASAPISMTRMQLEEVFACWEQHVVP
ncbi:uncharacterized protein LOC131618897 [Vicia villosa]|uniref:uncharacterized protein LOC131618897 n=1 Tax=Vicia villosa TaxID=3911 RepID=UPI00273AC333|nr:uncharacterized protein LOC131618897 [Vicia villosa]